MNRYNILWNRNDYGRITIDAETEDEARELFDTGEWDTKDLNIKGGQMDIEDIELLEEIT